MRYENEARTALELATKAGMEIRKAYFGGAASWLKADKSPVTEADLASNKVILEGLVDAFPADAVVSEESETRGFADKTWYVDPLDGTKSFIKRTDHFTVMIGLAYKGVPVMGVVHKPLSQESYLGIAGEGAWRIGPQGHRQDLSVNLGLEGIVAVVASKKSEYDEQKPVLDKLGIETYVMCNGEGFRLLKMAEGFANFRIGGKASNTWDVCAPMAVLSGAGGLYAYESLDQPVLMEGKGRVRDNLIYGSTKEIIDFARNTLAKK